MRGGIVSESGRHEQVSPIRFGKRDGILQLSKTPLAESKRSEADPLEIFGGGLRHEGQLTTASRHENGARGLAIGEREESREPALCLRTQGNNVHGSSADRTVAKQLSHEKPRVMR